MQEKRQNNADIAFPRSLREAVAWLVYELPLKEKATIANMKSDELEILHLTLGGYVRENFGLWGKNKSLMDSCRSVCREENLHPKIASQIILKSLWERLRKTHRLNVVK